MLLTALALDGACERIAAQDDPGQGDRGFALEQNYPNPFNPDTRIPFVLHPALFEDGEPVVVTIRIFNILNQYVASPTAVGAPGGQGLPLLQVEYPFPGRYEAYWDGRNRSGESVASGVYLVQMVVRGRTAVNKMFVAR